MVERNANEARAQIPQNQTFADLKHGNRISVVDLSNPTRPTRVQELAIAERPTSVSINHDGSLVSVTFHPDGAGIKTPLALIPFSNERLGQPAYPVVPRIPQGHELIYARIDALAPTRRQVLLIRLVHELEDRLNLGIFYCGNPQQRREYSQFEAN